MKTNFCPDFTRKILAKDFEAEVKSIFCCWSLIEIMKIILGRDSQATFGQDFEVKVYSRNADIWLRSWSSCLVKILKMKSDQDLFENLWYDQKKLL